MMNNRNLNWLTINSSNNKNRNNRFNLVELSKIIILSMLKYRIMVKDWSLKYKDNFNNYVKYIKQYWTNSN